MGEGRGEEADQYDEFEEVDTTRKIKTLDETKAELKA